jgi:hypothetical protein
MRSNNVLTVIFVIIVVAVLVGEVYVYTMSDGRCSSEITITDGRLEYSVTSKGSENYSVVVSDNGSFEKIESYYIYYDADYGSKLEKARVPIGAKELTQEYHIEQLIKMLNIRGICDITMLNAADLAVAMRSDFAPGGKATSKGLVVLSGALPYTIYTGYAEDTVFKWITAGGSLYWAGNILGKYCAKENGTTDEVIGYETLFFGPCMNTDDASAELSDVANGYRYSLSLMNSSVKYGIDPSKLSAAGLAVGYTDGTYCSSVLVKFGSGMICVFAGDLSNEQRHDLAQIIASGICYDSKEAGYAEGNVKRGTVTGTIDAAFKSGHNYTVYIYCGGYFTVYGKTTGYVRP